MICLGYWGVSGLLIPYTPHKAYPIRDGQSLIHLPVYAIGKTNKKILSYSFIWTITDSSTAYLIGCWKQPVKCALLSMLEVYENISTFLTWIVRNYLFEQFQSLYPGRSSRFVFWFSFLAPSIKKKSLYTNSAFFRLKNWNYIRQMINYVI